MDVGWDMGNAIAQVNFPIVLEESCLATGLVSLEMSPMDFTTYCQGEFRYV